ncbi:MAG TPA: CHAD domain-containing protein, partial [Aggregicoccus sp.]|nr:CHAD domain-containing protein [Aggregicoccus sp.]
RQMTALLETLVPLQEALGELHDVDVRLQWLGQLAAQGAPAVREAARALLPEVQEERRRCAGETAREVQRWRTERLPRALRRLLG